MSSTLTETSIGADGPAVLSNRASVEASLERMNATDLTAEIERLPASGLNANRWTSPDLVGQIRELSQKPVKYVIAAALDLDPALPLQRKLAASHAMDIAAGAAALVKLAGASRVVLAVPEDMSSAGVAALRAAASVTGVRLFPLPAQYPLAHPSLLIRRITGRRLPPDQLPTRAGVLLLDGPAALAAGRWFVAREPMLRVPLGVYDRQRSREHMLWVAVGTKLAQVLESIQVCGVACELRVGQMLRDQMVSPDEVLGNGELTFFASEPHPAPHVAACLRCGWCVEACPVDIHPAGLLDAAQQNDPHLADRYGLKSCIECGICSFVCPSRLPLLQSIRDLRKAAKVQSARANA
jgi:electron transport complex protein RnfC